LKRRIYSEIYVQRRERSMRRQFIKLDDCFTQL